MCSGIICGKQIIKTHSQKYWDTPKEKKDGHEEELGHAIIAICTTPMFGERMSTVFYDTIKEVCGNDIIFRMFIKAQNGNGNNIELHIHAELHRFLFFPPSDKPFTPLRRHQWEIMA